MIIKLIENRHLMTWFDCMMQRPRFDENVDASWWIVHSSKCSFCSALSCHPKKVFVLNLLCKWQQLERRKKSNKLNFNQTANYVRSRRRVQTKGSPFRDDFFSSPHFNTFPVLVVLLRHHPLFAIFNVNLTPNKCSRKQPSPPHHFAIDKKKSTLSFLHNKFFLCLLYIFFTLFRHFNQMAIHIPGRCCKMLFDSIFQQKHPTAKLKKRNKKDDINVRKSFLRVERKIYELNIANQGDRNSTVYTFCWFNLSILLFSCIF